MLRLEGQHEEEKKDRRENMMQESKEKKIILEMGHQVKKKGRKRCVTSLNGKMNRCK